MQFLSSFHHDRIVSPALSKIVFSDGESGNGEEKKKSLGVKCNWQTFSENNK